MSQATVIAYNLIATATRASGKYQLSIRDREANISLFCSSLLDSELSLSDILIIFKCFNIDPTDKFLRHLVCNNDTWRTFTGKLISHDNLVDIGDIIYTFKDTNLHISKISKKVEDKKNNSESVANKGEDTFKDYLLLNDGFCNYMIWSKELVTSKFLKKILRGCGLNITSDVTFTNAEAVINSCKENRI
ncbi:hypothetical protein [Halobacteriovorax sp. ZH2_bin.1]|uniref:hypothetical protein n=1 Tax=Halobacteriovorax sp. ZH2_bin.1 TaxID=3157724 RepID=UPI00372207E2